MPAKPNRKSFWSKSRINISRIFVPNYLLFSRFCNGRIFAQLWRKRQAKIRREKKNTYFEKLFAPKTSMRAIFVASIPSEKLNDVSVCVLCAFAWYAGVNRKSLGVLDLTELCSQSHFVFSSKSIRFFTMNAWNLFRLLRNLLPSESI